MVMAQQKAPQPRQSTNTVLMVSPSHFCLNVEAAIDNHFMNSGDQLGIDAADVSKKAVAEFEGLVNVLRSHEVDVNIYYPSPPSNSADLTPDAVFPNNWFSTHTIPETSERTLFLYPMKVPNRRRERRPEIIADLEGMSDGAGSIQGSIVIKGSSFDTVVNLTHLEEEGIFLEGTGSIVLDRTHKVAYAAISERTNMKALEQWSRLIGYNKVVSFVSTDASGGVVYHTNVIMAVGTGWAVVCAEGVENVQEREDLLAALSEHHEVITITREQVNHFCGNILELRDGSDRPIIAMSSQAYSAFNDKQKSTFLNHVHAIAHSPIPVIETIGGGGVRCSLAEIF